MLEIWEVFSQRLYDKFVPYILTQCGINKLFKFTNFLRTVRRTFDILLGCMEFSISVLKN